MRTSLQELDPAAEIPELLDLWNANIGGDFPLDERLLSQQLSLDVDPRICLAFRGEGGRLTDDIAEALDAGMRPRDFLLATDETDGSIAAFARIYDEESFPLGPGVYWRSLMGSSPGGLGPIGVDASRRGAGLGLRLLAFCAGELRTRGVKRMVIDWTDLVGFYGKLGFTEWKRYEQASVRI